MNLSGQQRKNLLVALNDAFRDKVSLEQMLAFELDKNLDTIAGGNSLQDIVFNLIKIAEAQGWVEDLVCAARRFNSGNPLLIVISEELFPIKSPQPHKVPSLNIHPEQSIQTQKILILAALPDKLRLDKEIREIEEAIKRAVKRDLFEINIRTAVRPQDIRRALAEERPQIVHFCGQGQEDGNLVLEDDGGNHKPVLPTALAALFKLHSDFVKCVLLNACYSASLASAISKHINYVIGMNQPIEDRAAIVFAQGFYDGLGYDIIDNKDVIQRAFDEGIVAIQLENLLEGAVPSLWKLSIGRVKPASEAKDKDGENIQHRLLFHELLNADFKNQVSLVKEVIQKHRTAAFLIHGEQYCGQQLLVTRLSQFKPKWKNISPIKIDVSQKSVGGRIPSLWQQLTSWFGLPKNAESYQIIQRVCDRLLTQDVIFIFDRVNDMQPKVLSGWLQEFWEPLVARVEENCPAIPRDTHLLMFLVDNNGNVCQSNILLAQKFDEPEYPRVPLNLPPIKPFTLDVLDELIDRVMTIPKLQISAELTCKILFEKSENGIPEFVYEEICDFCGHNWEGGLAKWLI